MMIIGKCQITIYKWWVNYISRKNIHPFIICLFIHLHICCCIDNVLATVPSNLFKRRLNLVTCTEILSQTIIHSKKVDVFIQLFMLSSLNSFESIHFCVACPFLPLKQCRWLFHTTWPKEWNQDCHKTRCALGHVFCGKYTFLILELST